VLAVDEFGVSLTIAPAEGRTTSAREAVTINLTTIGTVNVATLVTNMRLVIRAGRERVLFAVLSDREVDDVDVGFALAESEV
jgi:hypothetical protein